MSSGRIGALPAAAPAVAIRPAGAQVTGHPAQEVPDVLGIDPDRLARCRAKWAARRAHVNKLAAERREARRAAAAVVEAAAVAWSAGRPPWAPFDRWGQMLATLAGFARVLQPKRPGPARVFLLFSAAADAPTDDAQEVPFAGRGEAFQP